MNIDSAILEVIKANKGLSDASLAKILKRTNPFKDKTLETIRKKVCVVRLDNNIPNFIELNNNSVSKEDIKKIIAEDKGKKIFKESHSEVNKKYDFILKENEKFKKLLELQDLSKQRNKIYKIEPTQSKISEGVALALLSDLHAEERVDKFTVNNLNEFNPDICKQRVINYFENLVKLIRKERQDLTIKRLILGLLGDNINGDIHEEYKQTNYMTPIEASLFVYDLLISGIDYLLKDNELEKIDIVCKIGNHSRTTLKPYTNDEAKMSYEYGIYKHLSNHYKDNARINFILEESYFTYVTVYGKVIRFSHGHNIKYGGGIGGLTVPLIKYIHRVNEQIKADLDCMGHFHQRFNLPNALMNGSIVGFDGYALRIGARPERPMQTFQLIDSMRGFTVNTPILV